MFLLYLYRLRRLRDIAVIAGYLCLVVLLSLYIVMHCNEMSREQIKIGRHTL